VRWLNVGQLMEIVPLKKSRICCLTHVAAIPLHEIAPFSGTKTMQTKSRWPIHSKGVTFLKLLS